MPIVDLLGRRARTVSGVEVSTPTVRSFFRALEVFSVEIGSLRAALRQTNLPDSVAITPFIVPSNADGLAYVLEGIAQPSGVDTHEAALRVAEFVRPIAKKIDQLLSPPDAEVVEDDVIDGPTIILIRMAERLHMNPMDILDWPLALFLDARIAFVRPDAGAADGEMVGSVGDPGEPIDAPPGPINVGM